MPFLPSSYYSLLVSPSATREDSRRVLDLTSLLPDFPTKNQQAQYSNKTILDKERSVDYSIKDAIIESKVSITVRKAHDELTHVEQKRTNYCNG